MVKNIYKEIQYFLKDKHDKLFNEVIVDMCIMPKIFSRSDDEKTPYYIYKLKVDTSKSKNVKLNKEISDFIEQINQRIKDNLSYDDEKKHWKMFYLIKEILQNFVGTEESNSFNYFRGQASDWPLRPGIFRNDTTHTFIENFENIYKRVAYEYPTEIEYVEYSLNDINKRAKQLSLLQHYGMRTSLIDVTQNPYIAMLFMVSDGCKNDFNRGTIDLYRIKESIHSSNNIFMPVEKSDHNKRLTAQRGAFFNYDVLYDLRQTEIEPIDRIILRVSYDSNEIKKEIENQINKSNEEFREIQDDLSSNLDSQHETEITETLLSVNSSMEELINQLELLKINVNSLKKDILSTIREEIKEKLGEYFYFENSLFPDLDKYISYIQASYINNDENSKLEVAEFAENKE
ncbi:FRG domain-containing protein [Enterococcus faecalis]|uniref:FRG domain-containing protein n=1 Tax=Enterococcus faecalis TaxID=1351 RepID=UPI00094B409C|nr:FRG domain-containing protein [Enterococcus faecalis]EGO6072835.1 FRG domain-containing protein [Enterococcus faecalis]EGO8625406.1 FRG domain-containing protein [Enterococcus faecalis]EHA3058228.1 FRG domain-containing protein [Enterococcus faecalis]EJI7154556.1 FRG domain-containing protein [Enterococcus faecalis]MBA1329226.1 FRG domain-containing protein [Enterococcus faecalis]